MQQPFFLNICRCLWQRRLAVHQRLVLPLPWNSSFWKQLPNQDMVPGMYYLLAIPLLSSALCDNLGQWVLIVLYNFPSFCGIVLTDLTPGLKILFSRAALLKRTFCGDGSVVLPSLIAIRLTLFWALEMWLVCLINWIFKLYVNLNLNRHR